MFDSTDDVPFISPSGLITPDGDMNGADEVNDAVGVDVTDDAGAELNDMEDGGVADVTSGMKVNASAHGDDGTARGIGTGLGVGTDGVKSDAGGWCGNDKSVDPKIYKTLY